MKRIFCAFWAVLMLAQPALAEAPYGVHAYMDNWPGLEETEAFAKSVQRLDAMGEADGIRITLYEAICDGEVMGVSWRVENTEPDRPAIVEIEDVRVNGEAVQVWSDTLTDSWQPRMFSVGNEADRLAPQPGGMVTYLREERVTGELAVNLTLAVSRPVGPLVVVDPELLANPGYDEDDYAQMLRELADSGIEVADEGQMDPRFWADQGYTMINRTGLFPLEGMEISSRNMRYWEREGQMERTGTIQVAFAVRADIEAAIPRDMAQAELVPLAGGEMDIRRLDVSPLSTRLHFVLTTGETAADVPSPWTQYPVFAFYDAAGGEVA